MTQSIKYPRRIFMRGLLRILAKASLSLLSDFRIEGEENLPASGPLLVIANHFSFIDPVALLSSLPYSIEFVGGAVFPHAPKLVQFIPQLWGYYPVFRGTGSRNALRAAEEILYQNGVLGIMPEGGSWAEVLRPARPGAAYLASQTGAKVLPLGIYGLNSIFPIQLGKRPPTVVKIGKPVGPFTTTGRGRERREQLDQIGLELMKAIAAQLPDHYRGFLANDPAIREAALGTEEYPWDSLVEGQVEGEVH
ncbi:MAG: 1-acyl-sn-glycerol-3-phosphate acyltransferase [Anaerolineales bacterium]|nr:1-acyl-sn-glycerol-3-phosphate acyltransferase [Anaerolineales bacterium]